MEMSSCTIQWSKQVMDSAITPANGLITQFSETIFSSAARLLKQNLAVTAQGRGRAVDVQQFGPHCSFDHNAYGTHGVPFEGKFRSWTFTKLPGTEFEPHGLQIQGDPIDLFEKAVFPQ